MSECTALVSNKYSVYKYRFVYFIGYRYLNIAVLNVIILCDYYLQ